MEKEYSKLIEYLEKDFEIPQIPQISQISQIFI
jgi:hypothetical protein